MSMIHLLAWSSMPPHLPLPTPLIELPSHQNKKMESLLFLSRPLVVLLTFLLPLFPLVLICVHHVPQLRHLLNPFLIFQLSLLRPARL